MQGCFIKLWKFLLVLLVFSIWTVFSTAGTIYGAAICSLCVLLACVKIRRFLQRKEQELSGTFESYAGAYLGLSEAELTKILLQNELTQTFQGNKPVARSSILWRACLTLAYLVLNFLLISCLYYRSGCIAVCSLLTVVYVYLFCRFSTLGLLYRHAKKHPGKAFSDIVREECTEAAAQNGNALLYAGIGMLVLSLAGFAFLHRAPILKFSGAAGGYAISQYRPALLDQAQAKLPDVHRGQPVVSIGDKAFAGIYRLETVTMPDSVRTIGKQAFANCNSLKNIRLGSQLQSIGSGAFKNCSDLKNITLPDSLTELLGESFMRCSSLETIAIPASVTELRGNSFDGCSSLREVTLHNGIVKIHAYAFRGCKALKQIALPEKITEIHTYCFQGCSSLKEIRIPRGVTRIAAHAFDGCTSLTEVSLPDSLLEIRSSAFRDCNSLQTIQIPEGVSVDERAFKDSPTKLKKKTVSDACWDQIVQEAEAKAPTDTYYYIYRKDDPDTIQGWDDDSAVFIIDDQRFSELLNEGEALGQLKGAEELMIYLNAAKKSGLTNAKYCVLSEIGTDTIGTPYFVSFDLNIEDMIEICVQNIKESENG